MLTIIQKVLKSKSFNTASITQAHIDLCALIAGAPITLPLPVPNSPHVLPFSAVAGPENSGDPTKRTPGCYQLINPIEREARKTYIGQSVHLGNRVKDHASGGDPRTNPFVSEMEGKGLVALYMLTPFMASTMLGGLTLTQFLCVLEQYLFFLHRPLINGVFVATAGIP